MLLKNRKKKKRRSPNKIGTSPQSPSYSSLPPYLVPAQSIEGRVNKPKRHVCSPYPFYRNPPDEKVPSQLFAESNMLSGSARFRHRVAK
jgi:hypothetical protein